MWAAVRQKCAANGYDEKALERSIGCYAFGIRYGRQLRPWYIGKTVSQLGFRGEVFQIHKREHYDNVIEHHNGTPVMFLMPLLTPENRFSQDRNVTAPLIEWVEKLLLGIAIAKNQECRNQRDTRYLRNVVVRGIFGEQPLGRPGNAIVEARKMFGVD
jgi:hypothetical protein